MILLAAAVAFKLIVVHALSGDEVDVNPAEITNIREAKGPADKDMVSKNVKCVISMSDGKFISVLETCDKVKQMLRELENGNGKH